MKISEKILRTGLATIIALSAITVNVFAKTEVYNDDGDLSGCVYTADELTDINWESIAQIPSVLAYGDWTPTYNSTCYDLRDQDYADTFSIDARETVYSKLWTGSASEVGFVFNRVDNMTNLTMTVYRIAADGSSSIVFEFDPPTWNSLGYKKFNLSSSYKYYVAIKNNTFDSLSGQLVITNNPSDYGMN